MAKVWIGNFKGPTGDTGAQGPKGDTGATGATGATGPVGPQGAKGDTGATGAQGPKGDTGATGEQGPKGDTGPQGAKGDTGAAAGFGSVTASVDANVGTPSVTVAASGENTAKNLAFTFKNLKGEKGDKGDKGDKGAKGDTGAEGPRGPMGPGGMAAQLLWKNAKPTEATDAFEITMDEGQENYSVFLILCTHTTKVGNIAPLASTVIARVYPRSHEMYSAHDNGTGELFPVYRYATVYPGNDYIQFGDGYRWDTDANKWVKDGSACIPQFVYGIA